MLHAPATNDIDLLNPINWDDPLTQGLAFWHLNLPGRHGGTRAYDLVSGRLLTRVGMASPPTATSGPGTTTRAGGWGEERLDGTDDSLNVAGGLGSLTDFTLFASFFFDNPNDTAPVAMRFGANALQVLVNAGTGIGLLRYYDGTLPLDGVRPLSKRVWYQAIVTHHGTVASSYINGRADTTWTTSAALPPLTVLGAFAGAQTNQWLGALDDLGVVARAWTAQEAHAAYQDSQTFHSRMLRRVAPPWGQAAGTIFTQSLGGTLTTAAALPRITTKALVGAL